MIVIIIDIKLINRGVAALRSVFFFAINAKLFHFFCVVGNRNAKKNRHRQKNWRKFQKNPLKFDQKLKEIRENKCNFVFFSPAAADYRGKSYY